MFRAGPQAPDIGRALLTMLRTVAGLGIGRRGRGPVRGPSHLCNQCTQGHRRHGSVVSVQLARMMHEAVLLIIRRSWVRAPPAPPSLICTNVLISWLACTRAGLARCDAPITAADPVDDQAAVFPGCLLPREVTRVEGMDLAAGEEVVEVLVVRPRHEVIVAPGHDLGRRGDGRQQVTQYRVLLWVMPHEPGRLREPPAVKLITRSGALAARKSAAAVPTSGPTTCGAPRPHSSIRRARNAPEASGAISSGRPSEWPNPGRSMATSRPSAETRSQIRRKAQRVSGHGASSRTVISESALLSAYLTRTPSLTRK